MCEVLKVGIHL